MIEYLNGLELLLRTFWYIAIPTSLFFAIQTVMTFVGGDADGMDADFDSDVVKAAGGNPDKAFQLLLIEKLPELVRTQVEAVKNIKIDKITVWDSAGGNGDNSSTANFVSGMMKTVPPLNDLFKMVGLELPKYLKGDEQQEVVVEEQKTDLDEGDSTVKK